MKSSNSVPFYACLVEEVRSGAVPEKRNRNSLEIRNDTVLKIPSNPRAHVHSISFLSAHRHGCILPRTTLEPGVAASFSCTTLKPVATTSSFLVHLSLSLVLHSHPPSQTRLRCWPFPRSLSLRERLKSLRHHLLLPLEWILPKLLTRVTGISSFPQFWISPPLSRNCKILLLRGVPGSDFWNRSWGMSVEAH
jgi:hypothetical protein